MKHLDEYRDTQLCQRLLAQIRSRASRSWTLMEVCGGQTHGLLRYGIVESLQGVVDLIHGPGCPVCVTPTEQIDSAIRLARLPDVILTSFGDMLRVPGSGPSLLQSRAAGAQVRMVYSPLDAVELAAREPDRQVVFFAVGFETTVPSTALAVWQAAERGLKNFSILVSHVRVLPAMEQLVLDPHVRIDAFLAAGHVCTVTGLTGYHDFVTRSGRPVIVTGFEPVDLLTGILAAIEQLERGEVAVVNQYERSVVREGNQHAIRLIDQIYEPCDLAWRGLGMIPSGGFRLRAAWAHFDAQQRWPELGQAMTRGANRERDEKTGEGKDERAEQAEVFSTERTAGRQPADPCLPMLECQAADVLTGRIRPTQCAHFGTVCTPDHPLGAPMVSAEGACAAYFRYRLPISTVESSPVSRSSPRA